jgi:hypothetical protein
LKNKESYNPCTLALSLAMSAKLTFLILSIVIKLYLNHFAIIIILNPKK